MDTGMEGDVAVSGQDGRMELDLVLATVLRLHGHHEISDRERREFEQLIEITRAMERIAEQQAKTLDWLRANMIVFDNLDDHWQKVAFSIYTDLCEVDTIARAALARLDQ